MGQTRGKGGKSCNFLSTKPCRHVWFFGKIEAKRRDVVKMALSPSTIEAIQTLMARANLVEQALEEQFVLGSGSGGQKINKTSSAVRLTHLPTGLAVKIQSSRSREENRWLARRALAERILEVRDGEKTRKQQEQEKIRRQKRRRSRRQKARMLDDKARHADKKAARRWRAEE